MSQGTFSVKTGEKLPHFRSVCTVALGSNQQMGKVDLREILRKAIHLMVEAVGVIRAESPMYRTPAFPAGSGPDFVNAVVCVETDDAPLVVLRKLHAIEAQFGRDRSKRWGQRTLDLDLIAVGDTILPDTETFRSWADLPLEVQIQKAPEGLVLPHPRMHERAFVLIPMADVAPDWIHPVLGRTVAEMCEALPKSAKDDVQIA